MQAQFDEMIGTPPPSTVDVPTLVRRKKRSQAVRRAGYCMSAVVAAAVTGGVLISVDAPGGGAHAGPPVAQPAPDTRFQLRSNDKESAQATEQRLRVALDHAVKKAAPGVQYASFTGNLSNPTKEGLPFIVFAGSVGADSADMFAGDVNVVVGERHGVLSLMALALPRPGDPVKRDVHGRVSPPTRLACDGVAGCTEGAGPHGEKLVMVVTRKGDYQDREVRIGIPGDRLLCVSAANVDATDAKNTESPPLTIAQLTAIAEEVAGQIKA